LALASDTFDLTVSSANGNNPRQYDVDIRNAPIAEEDGDAGAASASLASTLRAVSVTFLFPSQSLTYQ